MVERDKDLDFRPIIFVSLTRYVYLYPNARNFLYPLREEERLAGEALRSFVWAFCEQRARGGKVDGGDNGGSSSPNDNHFASRANFETISGSKVGGFSCEVPLRPSIVPLLPRRASHCSLVSLTVRKSFFKILLSYVWYTVVGGLSEARRGVESNSYGTREEEEINRGGSQLGFPSLHSHVEHRIDSLLEIPRKMMGKGIARLESNLDWNFRIPTPLSPL